MSTNDCAPFFPDLGTPLNMNLRPCMISAVAPRLSCPQNIPAVVRKNGRTNWFCSQPNWKLWWEKPTQCQVINWSAAKRLKVYQEDSSGGGEKRVITAPIKSAALLRREHRTSYVSKKNHTARCGNYQNCNTWTGSTLTTANYFQFQHYVCEFLWLGGT